MTPSYVPLEVTKLLSETFFLKMLRLRKNRMRRVVWDILYKQLQHPVIRRIHEELEIRESNKFELRNGVVYKKHNNGIFFPFLMQ